MVQIKEPTQEQWTKFVEEYLDFSDSDKNFRSDFKILSAKCGVSYFYFLHTMWLINNNVLSVSEFCYMNCVPEKFFEKNIKNQKEILPSQEFVLV